MHWTCPQNLETDILKEKSTLTFMLAGFLNLMDKHGLNLIYTFVKAASHYSFIAIIQNVGLWNTLHVNGCTGDKEKEKQKVHISQTEQSNF
jgi:hypothetical protein